MDGAAWCLGIDADPIGRDGSGNEMYLRGVVGGLLDLVGEHERVVLAGRRVDSLAEVARSRASVVGLAPGPRGELTLGRALHRAGATVALGHYVAPFAFPGPVGTVVHDVAYLRVPETYPTALRLRLRVVVPRSLRRSRFVVTVSEFSRRELLACYPWLDPARVVVTPNAPSAAFFDQPPAGMLESVRRRYRLADRFVLAVGNLQPRKNLPRLIAAVERLGLPLVVVGQKKWMAGDTGADSADQPGVVPLGYVPAADLACLYRLCTVFAYPSLYEGFGIPVVEAMAAGAPVVTSDRSALPEVAGEAAVLVDPTSTEAIAAGIDRVATDAGLAARLVELGTRRARQFSWTASAAVLREAVHQFGVSS